MQDNDDSTTFYRQGNAPASIPKRMTSLAFLSGILLVTSCDVLDPRECVAFNDCPSGEVCNSENVCETAPNITPGPNITPTPSTPTPSPPDGGAVDGGPVVDAGGDGGTPGVVLDSVQTQYVVDYIQPNPSSPTTSFLIAQYNSSGAAMTAAVDELRAFNATAGSVQSGATYDLIDAVDGPCHVGLVREEPALNNGETWFSCDDGLRIYYDLAQPAYYPGVRAHHGVAILPSVPSDNERRIWFERGGSVLNSFVIQPSQDGIYIPRQMDTIQDTTFTGILGVVQLQNDGSVLGESILVVDRNAETRIVFMVHDRQTNVLRPHSALSPQSFGDKAHTVEVIGDINIQGQANAANVANIMVFEPETGRARYYKAENGEEVLPPTIFEPTAAYKTTAPAKEKRLLHVYSPNRTAIFYAVANVPKVWRVPLAPGSDNDVKFYLGDPTEEITGIFPISEDEVWVTTSGETIVLRVELDQ